MSADSGRFVRVKMGRARASALLRLLDGAAAQAGADQHLDSLAERLRPFVHPTKETK